MQNIGIDLTWIRHNKVGGTESCTRNLLNGFKYYNEKDFHFFLLLGSDSIKYFQDYKNIPCMTIVKCPVNSENKIGRVLFQNIGIKKIFKKYNIHICLELGGDFPVLPYSHSLKYIVTIHDLQALHFPEYFSFLRKKWNGMIWKNASKRADKIIAISEFVKLDIIEHYNVSDERITTIYDAIDLNVNQSDNSILEKYGLERREYYYCVSSLFKHKNLDTLVRLFKKLKDTNQLRYPLVISGIGTGTDAVNLKRKIELYGLESFIIFTEFISDAERNALYMNAKIFLFPSVFEGFGMPPIEAMALKVPVITTKMASIPEVTKNMLNYVDDPYNVDEWISKMDSKLIIPSEDQVLQILAIYESKYIAMQYVNLLRELYVKE